MNDDQLPEFNISEPYNPKGWGISLDPKLPSEHGHWINDQDIENISEHVKGFKLLTFCNGKYRALARFIDPSKPTIISIPGGQGQINVIDSVNQFPRGLLYPTNLLAFFPDDVNYIVVDFQHGLPWNWIPEFYKSGLRKLVRIKSDAFLNFIDQIDPESTDIKYQVLRVTADLYRILEEVCEMTTGDRWMLGHSGSPTMMAVMSDSVDLTGKLNGIIMGNPAWRKNWEVLLEHMIYFRNPLNDLSLLVIQHKNDPCVVTNVEISTKIYEQAVASRKKLELVDGGIDQGAPHFSAGLHGFRGIESTIVDLIMDFIRPDK